MQYRVTANICKMGTSPANNTKQQENIFQAIKQLQSIQ